ncbi:MAG: MATE family efflux transporter [Erysipelotrichaceae bacterium]|jgi:putative MATE family efflux protein|nr:MATE family efflux transporter [Erysipelotrichaceae bacterium]
MRDFTKGNATKHIIIFALPMLVGNIFQQIYNVVDAMVVGQFVGGSALGAVGTGGTLFNFLIAILMGLTTGTSVLISQYYGAQEFNGLKRTVSTSMIFFFGMLILLTFGGIWAAPALLTILGVTPEIFPLAVIYLRVILGGMVFTITYNMYMAYLRALGNTRIALYSLVLAATLNVCLDLYFVTQLNLGVFGVAIATVISQGVAAAICFFYVLKFEPLLQVKEWVFETKIFRNILRYSIPAAIQLSLTSLGMLTIMSLVNSFGTTSVAGFTAGNKLDQMVTMPLANVSAALSTYVAQNIGANLEKRCREGLFSGLRIMFVYAIFISLVIMVVGPTLVGLFVNTKSSDAAQILAVGLEYMHIMAFAYFLFAIFFCFNGFFRGVGDALMAMAMPVFSLAVRVLFAYILARGFGMGIEAVAYSIPMGWGLSSLVSAIYYRAGKWRGKAAVQKQASA